MSVRTLKLRKQMGRRKITVLFILLNLSLFLAESGESMVPNAPQSLDSTAQLGATGTDLNSLMFSKYQEWDAALTRWASINGSLSDPYDRAQAAPGWNNATLSGMGSLLPMISFYETTHDEYYLRKIQFFVDKMIEESWFKTTSDIGEIYYVPSYWYAGKERDTSGMKTMWFATAAVKLYQWTGLTKYKQLADDVASQSMNLVVVNNVTDMAWSWAYHKLRDLTNAQIGVNRQTSTALFYSLYGSVINSTFSTYVPKIVNWVWRSQLASGGLAYSIGLTSADIPYSAFCLAKALYAYQYASNQFDTILRTKMNSTLTWLRTGIHGGNNFNYNNIYIIASAYVLAVKTGFYTPTQSFLDTTKTVIYTALQMINVREKGHVTTFDDFAFGYRWAEYYNSYFFSTYPLSTNLQTYTQPVFAYEPLSSSRVKLIGAGFQYIYGNQYLYGDLNLMNGIYQQSYITTYVAYKSGTYTRNVTAEPGYLKAWANSTSPRVKVLQYWYPSYTTFANVTGNGSPRIFLAFVTNAIVRVSNGTVYDLSNMNNGTRVLSNDFMIVRNVTSLEKETQFIYTPNTSRWNFTRFASKIILESTSLTNYQITAMGLITWDLFGANITKVYGTMKNLVIAHHSQTPVPYDTQISLWRTELNKIEPQATWLDTYKSATNSEVRLIAHSNPEKVLITDWAYTPHRLDLTIEAPSGTNSSTKIFCGEDAKPETTSVKNGVLAWNYDASVNTLTLNVTHSGVAEITVNWKITGTNFVEEISFPASAHIVDVDSAGRIFVNTNGPDNDIYRSTDNGITWTKVLDGMNSGGNRGWLLYVDSRDYVYATLWKTGSYFTLYRSIDHGDTWSVIMDNIVSHWQMDEAPNGDLYWNNYNNLNWSIWRSTDRGASFSLFYYPSGITHVHRVGVAPNGWVWVSSGDASSSKIERYNGTAWSTIASGAGTQPTAFWFDSKYVYMGPDAYSEMWRLPLTGAWKDREALWKLEVYGSGNWVDSGQYYGDLYAFVTSRGQFWGSWDGEHWVKVWESPNVDEAFRLSSRRPIYFTDRTVGKIYRANIQKEDIVKLYYEEYNLRRGSVANAPNYLLEQRIWNGSTNYINLATAGLSTVQAQIEGLSRANHLNLNSGFEWNNMTGWTTAGSPSGKIVSDTKEHGTYSYRAQKSASDPQMNSLTPSSSWQVMSTPKGSIVTLSFWAKANTSSVAAAQVAFYNESGLIIGDWNNIRFTTNWQRYNYTLISRSSTNYPRMKWILYLKQADVTTWLDSFNWSVDQTQIMYGATGNTVEGVSYVGTNLTCVPYFEGTQNTQNPALIINGQAVSYPGILTNGTASPAQSLAGILSGLVPVSANIQGSGEAILRITGTRVVYEDSVILKGVKDSVYYGRYFGTFTVPTTTNATIIITNLQANITSLSYASKLLVFTVASPLGTNSTSIVYCADKGKPYTVLAETGALSWNYHAPTKTLTLQVAHSFSTAEITVDWRMPGDVDGDGVVDANDLLRINSAYGSKPDQPTWDTLADLNRDDVTDCRDLFIVGKEYGNTGP